MRALETLDAILSTGEGDEAAIGHLYMLAKTFRQMLVILESKVRDQRGLWAALWQGFRVPPFAAEDIIRQARRYKSKRELTRGIRLIAKADLALRSHPASKRLVLEKLVLDLTAEPKLELGWSQEELSVWNGLCGGCWCNGDFSTVTRSFKGTYSSRWDTFRVASSDWKRQ